MLSLQNINLPNVNKKMKTRRLGPFPITQVNYQCNNYTLDLSSNSHLRNIYKSFNIGLLKSYHENTYHEFHLRHCSEPAPVKVARYDV